MAVVLVLGLGVGFVTATFALADPYLLKPLPYRDPDELVTITFVPQGSWRESTASSTPHTVYAWAEWLNRDDLFRGVAAYRLAGTIRLRLPEGSVALHSAEVSRNFFELLGIPASKWSSRFSEREGHLTPLAVTTPAFRRLFGTDHQAIGNVLRRQGGDPVRLVEVLPPAFTFPSAEVARPVEAMIAMAPGGLYEVLRSASGAAVSLRALTLLARLQDGVTPEVARSALQAAAGLDAATLRVEVRSLRSDMTRQGRALALAALGAGLLVLLACAANAGALMLARWAYREEELAVREVLGATRLDLVRLLSVEFAVSGACAVVVGLGLATLAVKAARLVMPAEYGVLLGGPWITGRAVGFACAAAGGMAVMMLAVPATVWPLRPRLLNRQHAPRGAGRVRYLRFALMTGQSASATVLLIAAALLVRSHANLIGQDTGFSGHVMAASTLYPDGRSGPLLQEDIERSVAGLRRLRGVHTVAAATGPMVDRVLMNSVIMVDGQPVPATVKSVTPDYFAAVGSTFLAGRPLKREDAGRSVVVNEAFAKRCWGNGSAVGRRVGRYYEFEIVGVVRDTFDVALDRPPTATVFRLLENPAACIGDCNRVTYVLRLIDGASPPKDAVARVLGAINPDAIVEDISRLDDRLMKSIADRVFATLVLSLFAAVALTVCVTGLVGMVAFLVARRTRDIAVCMALGARPRHILRLVLAEGGAATAVGVLVGAIVGRWGSTTLKHFVYGVETGEWSSALSAGLLLLALASAGSAVTAMRALRLSPSQALRTE